MKFITLGLFLSLAGPTYASITTKCPGYNYENKPFSFVSTLMKADSTPVKGVYRKDGNYSYRTVPMASPQYDVISVVRAFYGDITSTVGSSAHYYITQMIQDSLPSFDGIEHAQLVVDEDDLLVNNLQKLQACHAKKPFTDAEISLVASDLLDKKFRLKTKQGMLAKLYVNDGFSDDYRDWAGEIVFSTYQPMVAALYGAKTLVFKEAVPRSIDKEFWQMKAQGDFHCAGPGDVQEALSPGYIRHGDLQGYIQRTSDNRFTTVNSATSWMIHKHVLANGAVIAPIFDTQGSWAPVMGAAGVAYSSTVSQYPDARTKLPQLNSSMVLPLLGVVTNCSGPQCGAVNAYMKNYTLKSSNFGLLGDFQGGIENQTDLRLRVVQHDEDATPPPQIEIIKATWGKDNVTGVVKEYCDGQTFRRYKINSSYAFPDQDKSGTGSFTIVWKCTGDKVAKTSTAPAPADDAILELKCN